MAYYYINNGNTSAYVKIDGQLPDISNPNIRELTKEEYDAALSVLTDDVFE